MYPAREAPYTYSLAQDRHRRHSRALLSFGSRAAQGTHCSDARAHEQAGCASSLKQMNKRCCHPLHPPTSCWIDPCKLLDWEQLWTSGFWGGLGVWKLRGRNQPLGSRASSRDTSIGLEMGRSLNAICHIRLLSFTHPISMPPRFCSAVGNTAERGLWLRDAAVCSTRWHRLVLLQTHEVCLGTVGLERGDLLL